MRVLLADRLPASTVQALADLGCAVDNRPTLALDDLPAALPGVDVLVVRSKKVGAEAIARAPQLRLIIRAGAGTNTIDIAAASGRGIYVSNCPGKNAVAVAELTIGLVLAADRRIPQAWRELQSGTWNKKEYARAAGLFGRRLGIVGLGDIGRAVAARAHGLGLSVSAWSRSLTPQQALRYGVEFAPNLEVLAGGADVVSVHLAYCSDTKRLLGTEFFRWLRSGTLIVNTSRGGIVDEGALLPHVESGHLRYACDVFAAEPTDGKCAFADALAQHPSVIATPHIGASTDQAQEAVAGEVVRIIAEFRRGGSVPNCVNLCAPAPTSVQIQVRHRNQVGVLASVLQAIREAGINVAQVDNTLFHGGHAALAKMVLATLPADAVLAQIRAHDAVFDVAVVGR
jgi:D-3-phosphoglycerate dehydrogenase